jgi:hypothetical protein
MSRNQATLAPHSWGIPDWPATVYPHTPAKARYLIRANRDALVNHGALTRIGRDFVVMGTAYTRWLESQSNRVAGYRIAANRRGARPAAASAA